MYTVTWRVPKALANEMDRLIASNRFRNRFEIVRAALEEFLSGERSEARIRTFRRRLREVAKDPRYRNRWVGLHKGKVVDADDDQSVLVRRILDRPEDPIRVGYATDSPQPTTVRVPSIPRTRTVDHGSEQSRV